MPTILKERKLLRCSLIRTCYVCQVSSLQISNCKQTTLYPLRQEKVVFFPLITNYKKYKHSAWENLNYHNSCIKFSCFSCKSRHVTIFLFTLSTFFPFEKAHTTDSEGNDKHCYEVVHY